MNRNIFKDLYEALLHMHSDPAQLESRAHSFAHRDFMKILLNGNFGAAVAEMLREQSRKSEGT